MTPSPHFLPFFYFFSLSLGTDAPASLFVKRLVILLLLLFFFSFFPFFVLLIFFFLSSPPESSSSLSLRFLPFISLPSLSNPRRCPSTPQNPTGYQVRQRDITTRQHPTLGHLQLQDAIPTTHRLPEVFFLSFSLRLRPGPTKNNNSYRRFLRRPTVSIPARPNSHFRWRHCDLELTTTLHSPLADRSRFPSSACRRPLRSAGPPSRLRRVVWVGRREQETSPKTRRQTGGTRGFLNGLDTNQGFFLSLIL